MNQTGGKKRKFDADHKIGGRRSKKKGQQIVNSGKLNFLPLDICEEIFKNLRPPDLLRLSWTSKDIRSFLMSRARGAATVSQWLEPPQSKQQELDVIKQEDFECKMWFMNILNALKVLIDKRKRSKLIYENEQTIIDYIRVMGWENEFKRVLATNPDGSPLKLDRVMRASGANKRITGAVLKRLEPILHQSMSEAKKERLRSEHMSSVGDQLQ
ncbi:hypothetical protein CVT25_013198 [Psilocybe cyanescens]|uniref:F-box domain-containing protein n=1 Tax=Psilocybe cyanescens TaxID=93625 RepID=A0A409XLJ0_PSICY|nr:hypothetical protein CVT25_013198 [Psilocybe cyanescens]